MHLEHRSKTTFIWSFILKEKSLDLSSQFVLTQAFTRLLVTNWIVVSVANLFLKSKTLTSLGFVYMQYTYIVGYSLQMANASQIMPHVSRLFPSM